MKKKIGIAALALCLAASLTSAFAAEPDSTTLNKVCYPSSVTQNEDKTELRKMYDLAPEDDPTGIPRSDIEQDGFHYTLVDLLKQELPENESRVQTETVSLPSKSMDMSAVLTLLPQEREFITDDGFEGVLSLQLDSIKVEVSGYGNATKELSATRTYPDLADQDTSGIPKSIGDNGNTLTLQDISWQGDAEGHFTATANYSGTTTSSYVKGYTVTADYVGTVQRIALNKTRYVAIYEGTPIKPIEEPILADEPEAKPISFNWAAVLVPIGIVALAGAGVGIGITLKRKHESEDEDE